MITYAAMSDGFVIYHNPRCSKSRKTLQLLRDRGVEPEIRAYLEQPPTAEEVQRLIELLGVEPHQLVRTKEAAYAEAGLSPDSDRAAVAGAIARHPILLERPVVVRGDRAVIGRPPENVEALL